MAFAAFKDIILFRKLSGFKLPNLDHLQIPQNVVDAGVTPRQCLANLYLLEHFVSVKAKIDKWAEFNRLSPESAWRFYVNMAVRRMQRWFLESFRVDLKRTIPPLDVLMAWYALLQSPQDHDFFMQSTGASIESFNWVLLSALEKTTPGDFRLPEKQRDVVEHIFPFPDLLELLDHCASFLQSARPDKLTDQIVHMFFRKERAHRFVTRSGCVSFRFDFHSAIDSQLEFANRILQHSWHRMYPPNQGEGLQLRAFIDRYNNFMSLVQFSTEIQHLETCIGRPPSLIPTLDIDLVWRTHMLCPREFRLFSRRIAGSLIQHTPSPRHVASYDQRTSRFYKHVFGCAYAICLCWPCVHSRDIRSFPPPSWTAKPAFEATLSEELIRRGSSIIETPLSFGIRQCHKCGSHPNRRCKAKDTLKGDEAQALPTVRIECVRRRRTVRERTMAQLAQTPWAQLALGCSVSR